MKKYIAYFSFFLFSLAGTFLSPYRDKKAAEKTSRIKEIPLAHLQAEAFAYNPAGNTLHLIQKKKHTYAIRTLQPDKRFSSVKNHWKIPSHYVLEHFVFNSTGRLFACRKYDADKGNTKQSLVFLTNKNRIKKIPLQKISAVPPVGADIALSPKKRTVSCGVQDIKFNGTALALTYHNGAVKFYNIAEGQALGASDITGTAGCNSFYRYEYLSPDRKNNRILRYDIRTGEVSGTVSLGNSPDSSEPFYMANYRERLYVLSKDGLFCGAQEDAALKKVADISELPITAINRIRFFAAARDNTLYISLLDDSSRIHLYYLNASSPAAE